MAGGDSSRSRQAESATTTSLRWNLVRDRDRWVFIDWDGARPGSRLWDLACSAGLHTALGWRRPGSVPAIGYDASRMGTSQIKISDDGYPG